ncbi:unnamed protein product [Clonostachys solani]|uniref:CorA-like transporter domain-containing protein n=1 Tax=Clonostachys solani TaxID=160281 RepID=A0A9N9Z1Q3_9HYPO|nr:unnamed protein product [Clonostachys solani]
MAAFLEHVFTFYFTDRNPMKFQHCFNLVGVEHDIGLGHAFPYQYRQTAAYFSFEPQTGKTAWIILKANTAIRDRILELVESQSRKTLTPKSSFSAAMSAHLAIFEWSIQNFTTHFNTLETQISETAKVIHHTPVSAITDSSNLEQTLERKMTARKSWGRREKHSGLRQRINQAFMTLVSLKRSDNAGQWNTTNQNPSRPKRLELPEIAEIFKFEKLQDLYLMATRINDGSLVLAQNKVVLHDLIERFEHFKELESFSRNVDIDPEEFDIFFDTAKRCVRELDNQEARLNTLQARLERQISLFNGILQYNNMRFGELYAELTQLSTEKMEQFTIKARRETVSIHVITILTLFFLPATFVATFLGSNIITFKGEEASGRIGDWIIDWSGLALFGVITGPLSGLVFSIWATISWYSRWQQKQVADLILK